MEPDVFQALFFEVSCRDSELDAGIDVQFWRDGHSAIPAVQPPTILFGFVDDFFFSSNQKLRGSSLSIPQLVDSARIDFQV